MGIWKRLLRRFFVKSYYYGELREIEERYSQKLKVATIPPEDRERIESELEWDTRQYYDLLDELGSRELIAQAEKMDIYLEDLPMPEIDDDGAGKATRSHFETGPFGARYLNNESRQVLVKAMHDRAPNYRKEQREVWDLRLKAIVTILSVITGLVGTITGLVALLKK